MVVSNLCLPFPFCSLHHIHMMKYKSLIIKTCFYYSNNMREDTFLGYFKIQDVTYNEQQDKYHFEWTHVSYCTALCWSDLVWATATSNSLLGRFCQTYWHCIQDKCDKLINIWYQFRFVLHCRVWVHFEQ